MYIFTQTGNHVRYSTSRLNLDVRTNAPIEYWLKRITKRHDEMFMLCWKWKWSILKPTVLAGMLEAFLLRCIFAVGIGISTIQSLNCIFLQQLPWIKLTEFRNLFKVQRSMNLVKSYCIILALFYGFHMCQALMSPSLFFISFINTNRQRVVLRTHPVTDIKGLSSFMHNPPLGVESKK